MTRRLVLAAAIIMLAAVQLPAPRASAAGDPAAMVQSLGNQTLTVLRRDVPPAERLARFRVLFHRYFDVPGIARFVLGRYWLSASPRQREQFVNLFDEYITAAYSDRLSKYGGETLRVTGSRPGPDGALVASEIVRPSGAPSIKVDWRITNEGGKPRISDVIVDGVSLAVTQRSEFASVIQRDGGQVSGLMQLMREKTASSAGSGE
ncbi:MAG TPA: ABC transporter substrate-binding protein [Stellaceae bacterium]|nr:ABC transporter substrate-binding protein [Stellaceae bacterium]